MHLSAINLYPVKSCRSISVQSAEVDDCGLVGDHRFLVTMTDGMFITQRKYPRMALIDTALAPGTLTLSAAGHGGITVPLDANHGTHPVVVWKDTVDADDCGDEAAAWLTKFLGMPLRLVRMGAKFHRTVRPSRAKPGDIYTFADGAPFMVLSEASLADLNTHIVANGGVALPMNRFRPNFVVAGCAPYAEDTWPRFRLGDVSFRSVDPCTRCILTTTDQLTAERGKEPLKTLATYRRNKEDPTDVDFGQMLVHETKRGTVRVGDPVVLL